MAGLGVATAGGDLGTTTDQPSALRERAEVVLVDAPGALDVGDVVALASRVDGIVVVARSKVLRRRTLAELDRLLTMVRAPALGFVATGEGEDESYAAGVSTHGYRSP